MFCVAVGLAGKFPLAQVRAADPGGVPWFASALWTPAPAQAGKKFSKNGTGWTLLTSVPAAACFESIVPAWKYVVLLAGSVGLAGCAKSTCMGRRLPAVPT